MLRWSADNCGRDPRRELEAGGRPDRPHPRDARASSRSLRQDAEIGRPGLPRPGERVKLRAGEAAEALAVYDAAASGLGREEARSFLESLPLWWAKAQPEDRRRLEPVVQSRAPARQRRPAFACSSSTIPQVLRQAVLVVGHSSTLSVPSS